MLLAIRDKFTGVVAWIVVIFICIPFAFWGIQEYLGFGQSGYAIKINGQNISPSEYDRTYSFNKRRLAQSFGGKIPAFIDEASILRKQTIETLTNRELLVQAAEDQGFGVGDAELANNIKAMPDFQKDGKFDKEIYDRQLQSSRLNATTFEKNIERDLIINQYRQGFQATAFVSKKQLSEHAKIEYQLRNIDYAVLPKEHYEKEISISDEEVKNHYEANADSYMTTETVSIEYLEVSLDEIGNDIPVTDDILQQLYDEKLDAGSFATDETRNASHILIRAQQDATPEVLDEKRAKAQALYESIKNGEDFAEIAKKESEDPGSASQGGSLGDVNKGIMVKQFEETLFSMAEGEVSQPIKTVFGFHLIKLHKINASVKTPFAEVRDQIERDYKSRQAEDSYYDHTNELANLVFEYDDNLSEAAEQLGLKLKVSEQFTKLTGVGVAQHAQVRTSAFSEQVLMDQKNSELIEIGENHVIALRIKDHVPSHKKLLEESQDEINAALKLEKTEKSLADAADKLIDEIKAANGLSNDLSNKYHAELKSHEDLKRSNTDVPSEIVSTSFRMPEPTEETVETSKAKLNDGNYAVIVITAVKPGDIAWVEAQEKNNLKNRLVGVNSSADLAGLMSNLKNNADIIVNTELE